MTSTIKVNTIQNTCGADIIKESGNTITLGASGDTVTLASGASQTGFGRSGSVNWQTTPKTSTFTAADGEGYFVNSGSALTMNLPAGSAGAIVAVSDYARNFATYNLTIAANGSELIGGQPGDATLNVNGQAATFVYVDGTKGWVNVQNAEDTETGIPPYLQASGGNTTITDGDYKIHVFTGPGTFTVCKVAQCAANNEVSYVIVAGGGGGGQNTPFGSTGAGAGGAGGYRQNYPSPTTAGLPVSVQTYPITVGAGGTGGTSCGCAANIVLGSNGGNSIFSSITSAGGGRGTSPAPSPNTAGPVTFTQTVTVTGVLVVV